MQVCSHELCSRVVCWILYMCIFIQLAMTVPMRVHPVEAHLARLCCTHEPRNTQLNAATYASVVAMYLPWRRAHYVTAAARAATMRTMIEAHALIDNRTMIEKNPATNRQSLEHPATPHQRLHAMIAVRQPRSECWSWRAPPVLAQPISSLLPSHGVAIDAHPQYPGGTCQVDRGAILLDC